MLHIIGLLLVIAPFAIIGIHFIKWSIKLVGLKNTFLFILKLGLFFGSLAIGGYLLSL